MDFIKSIISLENPDLSIFSVKNDKNMEILKNEFQNAIICPSRQFMRHIPMNLQNTTNPFLIDAFNRSIAFIDYNVFEHRKDGLFFNKDPVESFLKSIVSQSSILPFSGSDFSVSRFPNIVIISQDLHPMVLDVDCIKFISLPSTKDRYYAILDLNENIFEVKLV
jgi:hypothetical protein